MRLTKVDEDGRWWVGQKTDWAIQDKNGHWWILRDKKMKTSIPEKRKRSISSSLSWKEYLFMTFASALGIILGFIVAQSINAI